MTGWLAALIVGAAQAATVPLWTGPGDRACAGRCDMVWALSKLPEGVRRELSAVMDKAPKVVFIRDGDSLPLMTYYDNEPLAQHGSVASLSRPEPAEGWCISSGCFVLVNGCKNWAFVEKVPGARVAVTGTRPAEALGGWSGGVSRYETVNEPKVPAVPLPMPLALMLSALGALLLLRRR